MKLLLYILVNVAANATKKFLVAFVKLPLISSLNEAVLKALFFLRVKGWLSYNQALIIYFFLLYLFCLELLLDLIVFNLPNDFFPPSENLKTVESFSQPIDEKLLSTPHEKNSFTEYYNERVEFFNSRAGIIIVAVSVFSILVAMDICGIYPYYP